MGIVLSASIASMAVAAVLSTGPVKVGTYGNTYRIEEPDALTEIEELARKADLDGLRSELKEKFKSYVPGDVAHVEPAEKNYSYTVDMTYTLEYDIPEVDGEGNIVGVLYPRGFRFNPLDYIPYDPPPLVVFDGESEKERMWVKRHYAGNPGVMLLLTRGDWYETTKEMGMQAYYLKSIMAQRLDLRNTVSVVYRHGAEIRVDVYAVKD